MESGIWKPRKHRAMRTVALVVLLSMVALIGTSSVGYASTSLRQEIEQLRGRLNQIQGNMSQFEADLGRLHSERAGVSQELGQTQLTLRRVESELDEALIALELAVLQVQEAEEDLVDAERELTTRNGLLNGRIRAMYELGSVSYLEVLLTSVSFGDFVRRFQLLQQIVNQDVSILEAIKEQKAEVEHRRSVWIHEKDEASYWRDQVVSRRQQLQVQVATYETKLNQLTSQQREYTAALDELERRSEQIAREITEKQKELALAAGIPYLQWPLDRGSYWISSPFGSRYHPILKQWRNHTGVDLAASSGTPIRAAASGVVLDAGWMGGYGLAVIVAHTSTVSTLYAHASQIRVQPGQRVNAGDTIALVGSTGWSTGPHLHFEVRRDGNPEDPMKYLPSR